MLTKKEVAEIKKELEESKNPLFFFHDDPDGICSFLLLYKFIREGHGIIIKTLPNIDEKFLRKVKEYKPDRIFITDIAMVEQDFIDQAKTKIIWIDHHQPLKRHGNVKYYNPRIRHPQVNIPASYLCYQVVNQNLWIAVVGCIGDWYFPDFAQEFKKKYPKLLARPIKNPEVALYTSELGKLVRIFSFILKGKTSDAMKCVKILTRIKEPKEILEQTSPGGTFIYKKFAKINKDYELLLRRAEREKTINKILMFTYSHTIMSFTSDLANEMLHRHPNKIILIAREKSGEMRMSLRSKNIKLPPILKKALKNVDGRGGGHEYACGANVRKMDFKRFVENLEKQL